MGRKKGFKLSEEQKARMQEGRKKNKKKIEDELGDNPKKTKGNKAFVAGYVPCDTGRVSPVFTCEVEDYKGRFYTSINEAIDVAKKMQKRATVTAKA